MKTEFFAYDRLTWPDVKALPRRTPLVLPLGEGYSLEKLAFALGDPPRAGMLPAMPFGWEGSGLKVDVPALAACLTNLLDCLEEDGFEQVRLLVPEGLAAGFDRRQLNLPAPVRRNLLPADSERTKVILMPVGHVEQHGFHLPLAVDTLIIDAISRGTAGRVPELAASLPAVPYGVSTHRRSFAGTMNVGGRAFEDFWLAVVEALVRRGFDRFYLLSGHGGNCSFLTNVVKYAGDRHRRIFCATSFLYLSGPAGTTALEKHRRSTIGGMGHACELETALILHLHPDLVQLDKAVDETDFITTTSYYMDWIEGGALNANPPWDDDTRTGAYGAGSLADAGNGRIWLEAAIAEKAGHVREIHEQHNRREARRKAGFGLWGA